LKHSVDMKINAFKTVCIRIGPRSDSSCAGLAVPSGSGLTLTGRLCRHMYFAKGRTFRCTFEEAKKEVLFINYFYSSLFICKWHFIYSKIGRYASEEVVLNLLNTKCISAMLYSTEECRVMSLHKHSLDVVTRVFMKILCTDSKQIVEESQKYFGFFACEPPYWYSHCSFSWSFQHIWKQFVQCLLQSSTKTRVNFQLKKDMTEVSSRHILRNAIHKSFLRSIDVTFDSFVNLVNVLFVCLFLF